MAQENLDEHQMNVRRRYFFRLDGIVLITLSVVMLLAIRSYVSVSPDAVLPDQDGPVHAIAFSPDGKLLASGGSDGIVRVWNLATLREQVRLTGHTNCVGSLIFSSDGKTLVSTDTRDDDRSVCIWDMPSERLIATVSKSEIPSWTRRIRLLKAGDVRIWEVKTGRLIARLDGFSGAVSDVEFSPDGGMLATANYDGKLRV